MVLRIPKTTLHNIWETPYQNQVTNVNNIWRVSLVPCGYVLINGFVNILFRLLLVTAVLLFEFYNSCVLLLPFNGWTRSLGYVFVVNCLDSLCLFCQKQGYLLAGLIPLRAKQVGEFIEIRHKKISPTSILSTLGCMSLCHSVANKHGPHSVAPVWKHLNFFHKNDPHWNWILNKFGQTNFNIGPFLAVWQAPVFHSQGGLEICHTNLTST